MTTKANSAAVRSALRAAVAQRQAMIEDLARIHSAVSRAAELVVEADAKAASFAGLAAEAASYRARLIKEAAGGNGGLSLLTLPPALVDRKVAKASAEEEAEAARATHAELVAEANAAESQVAALTLASHDAVMAVISEEADLIASELAEAEANATDLRQRLTSLAHLHAMLPGMPQIGLVPLSRRTQEILRNPPRLDGIGPKPDQVQAWRERYLALASDPAAQAVP